MKPSYEELRHLAAEHGQNHLFQYWGELDASQGDALLSDMALIDFPSVSRLAGEDPAGCLRWGSALGASCVRSVGATESVFNREEADAFMRRHVLEIEAF